MPLAKRYPWFSQPPVGVPVDLSNPVVRNLVWLDNVAANRDSMRQQLPTYDTSGKAVGGDGVSRIFTGSERVQYASPIAAGDLTLFCVLEPTTPASTVALSVFNRGASAVSCYIEFGATTINATWTDGSNWVSAVGPTFANNTPYTLAATFKAGAGCELFVNGKSVASNATARTLYGLTDINIGCYGYSSGGTPTYSNYFKGRSSFSAIANKILTASEIATLSGNPWQIFQP